MLHSSLFNTRFPLTSKVYKKLSILCLAPWPPPTDSRFCPLTRENVRSVPPPKLPPEHAEHAEHSGNLVTLESVANVGGKPADVSGVSV